MARSAIALLSALALVLCALATAPSAARATSAKSSARKLMAQRLHLQGSNATLHRLAGDCESSEVHIAIADDQRTIRVAWRTLGRDCGSTVFYGELDGATPNGANRTVLREVLGTSYSLTEGIMCTAPARKKPFVVTMHVAHLTDLQPDTPYWYRMAGSSREFSFRSPIEVGAGRGRKFSFLAYGDMGESVIRGRKSPMAGRTMSTIMGELERGGQPSPVDLVVHVGDLAYADGSHKVWDSFMTAIEPLASRIPYMVGVGNHEYDFIGPSDNDPSGVTEPYHPMWGNFGSESGGECGAMTAKRFLMPAVRTATDNPPFWYSFDYGLVHFTMISTEHDISPGSMQYRWLARDLANVDRCVTPWLVVGMHRPFYVVYPHKDNRVVGDHLRDFMEDLLLEYQVDLTLAGHVHTYYRTCDVREERCTDDGSGVVHFVIGTAGHKLSDITDEQRDWLEGDVNDWGFVRFDVDDDTMRASFILSSSGEVADSTKLVTRIYTDEECVDLRAKRPAHLAALEQRLTQLQAQHAQREAEEALLRQQAPAEQEPEERGHEDDQQQDEEEEEEEEEREEQQQVAASLRRRL